MNALLLFTLSISTLLNPLGIAFSDIATSYNPYACPSMLIAAEALVASGYPSKIGVKYAPTYK